MKSGEADSVQQAAAICYQQWEKSKKKSKKK